MQAVLFTFHDFVHYWRATRTGCVSFHLPNITNNLNIFVNKKVSQMTQETSPQSTAHPKRYINLILCVCMFVPLSPYFAQIFPKGSVIMCFHGRVHKVARFVCFPGLAIFWFIFVFKINSFSCYFQKSPQNQWLNIMVHMNYPCVYVFFFTKTRGARESHFFGEKIRHFLFVSAKTWSRKFYFQQHHYHVLKPLWNVVMRVL